MTARVDLDAVDLTALVERVAAAGYQRWRVAVAAKHPDLPLPAPWHDLTPIRRHDHREAYVPLVADVLTGLREQQPNPTGEETS